MAKQYTDTKDTQPETRNTVTIPLSARCTITHTKRESSNTIRMHLLEVAEEINVCGMANEYEFEGRDLEVDPRAIMRIWVHNMSFEVTCVHHDKGTTVTITRTDNGQPMRGTVYFRVYDPAKETVPSFVSTTYTYHGLEHERAPEDVIKVIIHPSVKVIREGAFLHCKKLRMFEMHDDVEIIGLAAFGYCCALKSISLPRNLKKIGDEAFYCCDSMEECLMHDNVEIIEKEAFACCNALKSISLPWNLKKIGNMAFYGCERMEACLMHDNVEEIVESAFEECTALRTIKLSRNLRKIGIHAFYNCNKLEVCQLYDKLMEIGHYAFYGCSALKTIRLPKELKRIREGAFRSCRSLDAVFFPPDIEEYGNGIFSNCGSIRIVSLPTFIENRFNAFRGTDISFMFAQVDQNPNLPPLCKVCLDINVTSQAINECIRANGPASAIANTPGAMTPLHIMTMNPYADIGAILTCFQLNMSAAFERDDVGKRPLDYLWRYDNVDCLVSMIQALCLHRESHLKRSSVDIIHPSNKKRKVNL